MLSDLKLLSSDYIVRMKRRLSGTECGFLQRKRGRKQDIVRLLCEIHLSPSYGEWAFWSSNPAEWAAIDIQRIWRGWRVRQHMTAFRYHRRVLFGF